MCYGDYFTGPLNYYVFLLKANEQPFLYIKEKRMPCSIGSSNKNIYIKGGVA